MLVRITIGIVAAVVLELINGVLTFLLPPFIVITPICLAVAVIAAARVASRRDSGRRCGRGQ
jgi:hypothetical protein